MHGLRFLSAIIPAFLAVSCNFVTLPPALEPSPILVQRNTVSTYTPKRPPEVQVWLLADKLLTGMVFPYDWLIESGFIPRKISRIASSSPSPGATGSPT